MSGWSVEVAADGKVYESPPKKLIQSDSASEKDEDFANHVESYYQNPKSYKNSYQKLYDFFKQRYPL
jgi:Mlc titration factor MtfA (ptsG expression regulator)